MATTPETPRQFKWGTDSESARSEAVDDPRAQVGTIASIQTFGSYAANFHPHVHALITEGAFHLPRRGDPWFERVEWWDQKTLTELFRRLVLKELRRAKRLREETEAMLLSWQHSGFGVHAGEPVLPDHTERQEHLARYITRAPIRLDAITPLDASIWSDTTAGTRTGLEGQEPTPRTRRSPGHPPLRAAAAGHACCAGSSSWTPCSARSAG